MSSMYGSLIEIPELPRVAPQVALFWTNTHEEHWPGGWFIIHGVAMPYAIFIKLFRKCSTKVGPCQTIFILKQMVKGVPITTPSMLGAQIMEYNTGTRN